MPQYILNYGSGRLWVKKMKIILNLLTFYLFSYKIDMSGTTNEKSVSYTHLTLPTIYSV